MVGGVMIGYQLPMADSLRNSIIPIVQRDRDLIPAVTMGIGTALILLSFS